MAKGTSESPIMGPCKSKIRKIRGLRVAQHFFLEACELRLPVPAGDGEGGLPERNAMMRSCVESERENVNLILPCSSAGCPLHQKGRNAGWLPHPWTGGHDKVQGVSISMQGRCLFNISAARHSKVSVEDETWMKIFERQII